VGGWGSWLALSIILGPRRSKIILNMPFLSLQKKLIPFPLATSKLIQGEVMQGEWSVRFPFSKFCCLQ
jgi:hypothetical protein